MDEQKKAPTYLEPFLLRIISFGNKSCNPKLHFHLIIVDIVEG